MAKPNQPQIELIRTALYNFRDFFTDSNDANDYIQLEDIDLALDDSNPWSHYIAGEAVNDYINMLEENIDTEKHSQQPDFTIMNDWRHEIDLLMQLN